MSFRTERGLTLVELLIVVAIIGIIAAVAVPSLLSARRSGNQASAIASLRTINSSQRAFQMTCGGGYYATQLLHLAEPPSTGGPAFISPDLATGAIVDKSGYRIQIQAGSDGGPPTVEACNGVPAGELSSSYYATANPLVVGLTGSHYYWLGVAGTIFFDTSAIASTLGLNAVPGGSPIQ